MERADLDPSGRLRAVKGEADRARGRGDSGITEDSAGVTWLEGTVEDIPQERKYRGSTGYPRNPLGGRTSERDGEKMSPVDSRTSADNAEVCRDTDCPEGWTEGTRECDIESTT